ncbi:hypothetical protein ACT7CZ_15665, partial [Bacillus cereus]
VLRSRSSGGGCFNQEVCRCLCGFAFIVKRFRVFRAPLQSIYGIDICGELPVYPSQLFLPKYKNAIQKNEQANLQILKTIYKTNLHIQYA